MSNREPSKRIQVLKSRKKQTATMKRRALKPINGQIVGRGPGFEYDRAPELQSQLARASVRERQEAHAHGQAAGYEGNPDDRPGAASS